MTTIGFIYPDHAAEDDYPLAEQLLGGSDADEGDIRLPVEHIYGTDLGRIGSSVRRYYDLPVHPAGPLN